MRLSAQQKKFYAFLQKHQTSGQLFTAEDVMKATGWKGDTFPTYLSKGHFSDFISQTPCGKLEATNCLGLSEVEFGKRLSQSKARRELGHNCNSKLSKALLRKSRDNMMLALELYNRPSLENRMDAFVMCFCTAWEQLLKAMIIELKGEPAIFNTSKTKTLSLRECLKVIYEKPCNVSKNIERIADLRDKAVHLLMPEIQGITSRIFQSGVLNYTSKFEEFTQVPFLNNSHAGMISLVGGFALPPISVMKSTYGNVAEEIMELAVSLQKDVEESDDIEFAIPLNVKLVFASDSDGANTITLAKAEDGMEGLKKALVIQKPVDRSKTHPFRQKEAIGEINRLLYEKYTEEKIARHCPGTMSGGTRPGINQHCFRAVVEKNKWSKGENKFHHQSKNPEYHYYSREMVEEFVKKIMEHENYLSNARNAMKRGKKKNSR